MQLITTVILNDKVSEKILGSWPSFLKLLHLFLINPLFLSSSLPPHILPASTLHLRDPWPNEGDISWWVSNENTFHQNNFHILRICAWSHTPYRAWSGVVWCVPLHVGECVCACYANDIVKGIMPHELSMRICITVAFLPWWNIDSHAEAFTFKREI